MADYYHKPPDVPWNPISVVEHLRELEVDATVAKGCVQIAPKPDASWIVYPDQLDIPAINIRLLPSRFIRNIEVERHIKLPRVIYRNEIDHALTQQGYVRVTNELEGSIARKYCPNVAAIEEMEKEITDHQRRKERFVSEQNFDTAAIARDMEYDARARLDVLVRDAAAKATPAHSLERIPKGS